MSEELTPEQQKKVVVFGELAIALWRAEKENSIRVAESIGKKYGGFSKMSEEDRDRLKKILSELQKKAFFHGVTATLNHGTMIEIPTEEFGDFMVAPDGEIH